MIGKGIREFILIGTPAIMLSACIKDEVVTEIVTPDTETNPRPAGPESSASCNLVFEWTPAPGQFINEGVSLVSPEEAAAWALERLDKGLFVSLGGFGGYIVVGFDHSIINSKGGYDFAIAGNAFLNTATGKGGSNEPGIVYVMQDRNGNGLPDDIWYELKGSEFYGNETVSNYEVTYIRPSSPSMETEWTDNIGGSGSIDHLASFHSQAYYYPLWIADDSYTLRGTLLPARNHRDPLTGLWENSPYEWGYADNMGNDVLSLGSFPQCNRFRISDAVDKDSNPVNLPYIDFIKVQTGVNAKSGWLGELSTEVFGFFDLAI